MFLLFYLRASSLFLYSSWCSWLNRVAGALSRCKNLIPHTCLGAYSTRSTIMTVTFSRYILVWERTLEQSSHFKGKSACWLRARNVSLIPATFYDLQNSLAPAMNYCKIQCSWCDFSGVMCSVFFSAPATQDVPSAEWCEISRLLVGEVALAFARNIAWNYHIGGGATEAPDKVL